MILMKKISIVLMLFSACLINEAQAQDGWDWGNDKVEAQRKWVFVSTYVKGGDYEAVRPKVHWLLINAPDLHEDLYKQAIKTYENLVKKEKDKEQKKILQDSVLSLYDTRITKFGNEAKVLNRKGLVAYKYLNSDKSKLDELYNLYKKIFDLNKDKAYVQHAYYYFRLTCSKHKKSALPEQVVTDTYFELTSFIEGQQAKHAGNAKKQKQFNQIHGQLDGLLESTVTMDCEKIKTILGPKFKEDPENLDMAKKIYKLSKSADCFDDLAMQALELIAVKEPSYDLNISLSNIYLKRKDYATATSYLNKALETAATDAQKGDVYMKHAKINASQGKKSTARDYAKKAAGAGYSASEAYRFIGNLYVKSFEQCKSDDVLKTRSVFIAAYNMYEKAGATKKMSEMKQSFPSADDIYSASKNIGDVVSTGCWINETVKLQKRP